MLRIYYDAYQEGMWFKNLHVELDTAELHPFPRPADCGAALGAALQYDRPDIVLCDDDLPILVVERTVEVPSGHNVGQRFARLAAAAQTGTPAVYFGPYAAMKHGGATSGPRYMNLRLFRAIDAMMAVENSPVTTIRWPVDEDFEIVQGPDKDGRLIDYLDLFFLERERNPLGVPRAILESEFEREQEAERERFIEREVRRAAEYDDPPDSLIVGPPASFGIPVAHAHALGAEVVFYVVGMRKIRSDPYTGMAILYAYLYCGGLAVRATPLVLHFPEISIETWHEQVARSGESKTIRLFKLVSDGILFADGYLSREEL